MSMDHGTEVLWFRQITSILQPFAKMLALLDSEINKTHQNPILGFGLSLAHLSVARSFLVIGSV